MALYIGPKTIELYSNALKKAKTVIWNGPIGVFEMEKFSNGTRQIAALLAKQTVKGTIVVVGGGDSAEAVDKCGVADKLTWVSSGGGASLEMFEGKKLPAIEALNRSK
jgi:3-phosphoglycerate kinase